MPRGCGGVPFRYEPPELRGTRNAGAAASRAATRGWRAGAPGGDRRKNYKFGVSSDPESE